MSIPTNTILCILLLLITQCATYCFHNGLPEGAGSYSLQQLPLNTGGDYFSRFKNADLKPGESACCSYTNKDCNKHGNPYEKLEMVVIRKTSKNIELHPFRLTFPAGGSIRLTGSANPVDEKVEIVNGDGTRFEGAKVDRDF